MTESAFKLRLSDEEAIAVINGTLLAQLENGSILENPTLWDDSLHGKPVKSLLGSVGQLKYSWPACGCGVRMKVRAIPATAN